MNKSINNIYVLIKSDEVLFTETNLKNFVEGVKKRVDGAKSYATYQRGFLKKKRIALVSDEQEVYFLQKISVN